MRKLYFLILVLPAFILSGCTTNNNNPTVEERPFESVTLEEANTFFNDVIFKEDNLRQFFKDKILLDYSELDQLNYSDFQIGDIEQLDTETNSYEISFYHKYSNYELSLNLFLDREDDLILIYKVKIIESTYDYMQEEFIAIHQENIIKYLTDEEQTIAVACERFDTSNTLCTDFIQVIRLYDYQLSVSSFSYNTSYFTTALLLENEIYDQTHFATEIQVGLNDEGSFIYDLSYFQEYDYDKNNLELLNKFDNYIVEALTSLNNGTLSYDDLCSQYFYGEIDCLEGLTELDLTKPNTMVAKYLSAEEDYYKLFVDYSPNVSFSRNIIYYRIYESDNGNIFMHPVSVIYPFSDNTDDVSYYSNYLLESFSSIHKDGFCEMNNQLFTDCDSLEETIALNSLVFELVSIDKEKDELFVQYTLINPETHEVFYYTSTYLLKSVIGNLSLIDSIKTESIDNYYGTQDVKEIFTNYLKDIQNPSISLSDIEQKYDTDLTLYFGSLRDNLRNEDIDQYLEDWIFSFNPETLNIDVEYPLQDEKPFRLSLQISSNNNQYVFAEIPFSPTNTPPPMEVYHTKVIDTMLNKNISDDIACSYSPQGAYEEACYDLRALLQQENVGVYNKSQEWLDGSLLNKMQVILYDTNTNETIRMYTLLFHTLEIFTENSVYYFLLENPTLETVLYREAFNTTYQSFDQVPFTRSGGKAILTICDAMVSEENCTLLEELIIDNNILTIRAMEFFYNENKGDFFGYYEVEQFNNPDTIIERIIIATESYIIDNELIVKYKYIEDNQVWWDQFYEDN